MRLESIVCGRCDMWVVGKKRWMGRESEKERKEEKFVLCFTFLGAVASQNLTVPNDYLLVIIESY